MTNRLLAALAGLAISASVHAERDDALWQVAERHQPALVKELGGLVDIDSGTDAAAGLGRVEAVLARRLRELGAQVEVLPSVPAVGRTIVGEAAFRVEGHKAYGRAWPTPRAARC